VHKHLVGVGCVCQLTAYPCFCDFFVSVYSVIYVPDALRQCFIDLFDLLHPLVGSVDHVAAQLGELTQVIFGLLLLTCYGPGPDRGVGYFYHLFWHWGPVCDLEQVPGCFKAEHVEVDVVDMVFLNTNLGSVRCRLFRRR